MRSKSRMNTRANRPETTARSPGDDSWVDVVTDEVQALLMEHGLELELVAFYDPVGEMLQATGYDGAPSRFMATVGSNSGPSDSPAPRGNPMDATTIPSPAATRHETNEEAST